MNCFGWLLTVPNHYNAHLSAFREGRPRRLAAIFVLTLGG